MPTATSTLPDRLRELLADLEREPRALLTELRETRERAEDDDPRLVRELARAELDFLARRAARPRAGKELSAAVAAAERAAQGARERELLAAPPDDPAALFDLGELRAELRLSGEEAAADRVDAEIGRRVARIVAIEEPLRYEGGERYAALSTEEEERSVRHQVLLAAETRALLERVAAQVGGDAMFARLARRLCRRECDGVLQLRMERVLGRRGVVALETVSFTLLLALFVVLGIELSIGPRRWLLITDAWICTFFIAEFAFKLALAPARTSWFLRNALTDLLPAVPAALWFVAVVPGTELTPLARALRFLRIAWFARYVQALRPALRLVRLALFLVRGSDAVVRRFSGLLNRDFVFFERGVTPLSDHAPRDPRTVLFHALRREHVLIADLPPAEAEPILAERALALAGRLEAVKAPAEPASARGGPVAVDVREIPVEHAIEFLWRLTPAEVALWLPRRDLDALDRVVRVLNAPIVRLLPLVWSLRVDRLPDTREERVVAFGRRVAQLLERWRGRALHVADLHGIVSGPQVLDRIASGLIRVSQRPAVRLLLFGALFGLVRAILGAESWLGPLLARFVATPLVVLGGVCLVLLAVGRWLKALAGQASDALALTSEAHFHGLAELIKRRTQDADLEFLGRRVFFDAVEPWVAAGHLGARIRAMRTGQPMSSDDTGTGVDDAYRRVGLWYLHFLDGAPLHETDVKTTEQLLGNLSLENVRNAWLGWTKRDRKRLWQLAPSEGTLFRGPSVWFRFVTDSVTVETARRVVDYNRNCLTLAQRRVATKAERDAFACWLRRRRSPDADLLERAEDGADGREPERTTYRTTEFHALDFLIIDPVREAHLARAFGRGIVALLRSDREHMIREIFGTRPLDALPRSRRTLNFYRFYQARLAGGRVFLLPFYALWFAAGGVRLTFAKTVQVVREILAPERAIAHRERGRAPFAVAVRKILRMKGPVLLEAMHTRVAFDPAYSGAPLDWDAAALDAGSDLERDLEFLGVPERERAELRELGERMRARVEELRQAESEVGMLLPETTDDREGRSGRRALTVAWATDADGLRTVLRARPWFEENLPRMEDPETRLPPFLIRRFGAWVARGFGPHPVQCWLRDHHGDRRISRRGRGNFVRAWFAGDEELRRMVEIWSSVPRGATAESVARERIAALWMRATEVERELVAVRAIQSLSVLDVHNYRRIVFELGGYEHEGEDPADGRRLP